tara:strand:+ start:24 stop:311 length:288 start_codon:yes stop_codon:yes gene_type:complete
MLKTFNFKKKIRLKNTGININKKNLTKLFRWWYFVLKKSPFIFTFSGKGMFILFQTNVATKMDIKVMIKLIKKKNLFVIIYYIKQLKCGINKIFI